MIHGSAFVDAVQQGKPPAVDVADGLAAVAIGVAAELSIKEQRVVMLDEIMDGMVTIYSGPSSSQAAGEDKSSASASSSSSSSSSNSSSSSAGGEKRRKLGGGATWSTA